MLNVTYYEAEGEREVRERERERERDKERERERERERDQAHGIGITTGFGYTLTLSPPSLSHSLIRSQNSLSNFCTHAPWHSLTHSLSIPLYERFFDTKISPLFDGRRVHSLSHSHTHTLSLQCIPSMSSQLNLNTHSKKGSGRIYLLKRCARGESESECV